MILNIQNIQKFKYKNFFWFGLSVLLRFSQMEKTDKTIKQSIAIQS